MRWPGATQGTDDSFLGLGCSGGRSAGEDRAGGAPPCGQGGSRSDGGGELIGGSSECGCLNTDESVWLRDKRERTAQNHWVQTGGRTLHLVSPLMKHEYSADLRSTGDVGRSVKTEQVRRFINSNTIKSSAKDNIE